MNGLRFEPRAPAPGADTAGPWYERRAELEWIWAGMLVLAIFLVYQPAWYAGFIWDDDIYITNNPVLTDWHGLAKIWTTAAADISPFTSTTFWLIHALFGISPLPYHLANVLMHSACAVAFWQVLRSLQAPGAWIGAALWALHPVEVESVAWAAELKNPESGLFFLLAIFFFAKWIRAGSGEGGHNYGWALLFGALAMASKSSTVILPVILCLCAWWIEGRWRWRNVMITLPFFFLSAVASLVSILIEKKGINLIPDSQWQRTWPERLVTAGDAVWFYLGKLIWPHPLATIYPAWKIAASSWASWLPLIAVITLLLILWAMRRTSLRPCFFVFVYFVAALFPVLGLVENTIFQYSLVFDHFQYLASMGPLALAGAAISCLADLGKPVESWVRPMLPAAVLLILGTVSWQRVWVYQNAETLWTDALAKNPACWVGYNDLGVARLGDGRIDEAISDFRTAVTLNPHNEDGYLDLGDALLRQGKEDDALASFRKALEINGRSGRANCDIGVLLLRRGNIDGALQKLQKAVELLPVNVQARYAYAEALRQKGALDQALTQYQRTVSLEPDHEGAHAALGLIFSRKGQTDEAIAEYGKVVKMNPNNAEAYRGLGDAFVQKGKFDDAITNYKRCVELDPHDADAFNNLGNALLQEGRLEEAAGNYQKSLEIVPDDPMTHNNLGAVHFQMKQWDLALADFQKVAALDPRNDAAHYCLGLVWSKKGETQKAIGEYQNALALNPNNAQARVHLAAALAEKKADRDLKK